MQQSFLPGVVPDVAGVVAQELAMSITVVLEPGVTKPGDGMDEGALVIQ